MENQSLKGKVFQGTLLVFVLSMISTIIGHLIDGIITARFLGSDAMASFGFTTPYQRFTAIFPNVIALGMQILCSKSLGLGRVKDSNGIFSLAMMLVLVLAGIFTFVTVFFTPAIMEILGATEDLGAIRTGAMDYLFAYSLGLPAVGAVALLTPIMQLDGGRERAVHAVTALSAVNVIGDLVNIFYFNGGLFGMGLATTISYYVALIILVRHFYNPEANFSFTPTQLKFDALREMILNGSPIALGRIASTLRAQFFIYMTLKLAGGTGVAALSILANVLSLFEALPKALASSTQMISGILVGEQDRKSILQLMRVSLKYSVIVALILTAISFVAAPLIADIYVNREEAELHEMTVESLYWMGISMLPMTLVTVLQYFYQAYGRFKLVNTMAVLGNIGYFAPLAIILTPYFGMSGFWATFPLNHLMLLLTVIVVAWVYRKKISWTLETILMLPKDFDAAENQQINISITDKQHTQNLSKRIKNFCENQNIDNRRSTFAGICIEEMTKNIIEHGFNDGQKHRIDIRVIAKNDALTMRLRDDCKTFNPQKWLEFQNPEDPTAHIGIRLVSQIAKEFNYTNALKLNNLIIKI